MSVDGIHGIGRVVPPPPSTATPRTADLRRVLGVLRRRLWLLVIPPVVLACVVFAISAAQPSTYAASSKVIINNPDSRGVFDAGTGAARDPQRAIQTEIQVILGQTVRRSAQKGLDGTASVSARAVGITDIVEITATSTDPEVAARTANAYADAYIEHRRKSAEETLDTAQKEIQTTVDTLQQQITALDGAIAAAGPAQQGALVEQRNALIAQQSQFSQRLDQLRVDATLQRSNVELVDSAEIPTDPVSPQPLRDALLAAALGLLVAIGAAFALDRLDNKVRNRGDIERAVTGLPVLASVPSMAGKPSADQTLLIDLLPTGHPAAESYRSLRTSLQFLAVHRDLTVVQVTSATVGEGKSTTIANLALALADDGKTVTVVCCDLRRPRIHKFFGLDNQVGLSSVLAGLISLPEAINSPAHTPNVMVLSAGPPPPNPSELLATPAAADVFDALRESSDFVLIDSPPVLPVTDAAVLARYADATVLVAAAGQTSLPHLGETVERMNAVGAPLVGIVLNRVPESSSYGGYAYRSGDSEEPTGRRGLLTR